MSEQMNLKQAPKLDPWLCGAVLTLLTLGLVMVYSSSSAYAGKLFGDPEYFIRRQLVWCGLGLGAIALILRVPTHVFSRRAGWFALIAVVLCALVLIPGIGVKVGGARRWLDFGLARFQPSEFAKVALVILFAVVCSRRAQRGDTDTSSLVVPFLFAQIPIILIYLEPDLGTAVVIESVLLVMLLVAGLKIRVLGLVVLCIAPIGYHLIMGTEYRLRRVLGFIDPWAHRSNEGYQLTEALISIGSGGVTGLGLGQGKKQLFFLPEAHTDFIFAILAEELGFIGVVFFVTAFSILVFRCVRIAMRAPDLFRVFLATGITAMLAIPMLFNLAVATGLVPTKGLPLPFMSAGGSNMLMVLVCIGVLLRIQLESDGSRDFGEAKA